jgi:hypothetical protein
MRCVGLPRQQQKQLQQAQQQQITSSTDLLLGHLCPLALLLACFCSYIQRRAKEEFHSLAANADAAAAEAAWQRAQSQLEVWKRQSVVYQLYGRKIKTVLVSNAVVDVGLNIFLQ